MNKTEILSSLTKLKPKEPADDNWLDPKEMSNADKAALDAALADYQKNPDAGSSWEEVKARIQAKLLQ